MTREQLNKHWKEIEAFKNGAEIEARYGAGEWALEEIPDWFGDFEYRVKPKAREWWITLYSDGTPRSLTNTEPKRKDVKGWELVRVREVME